MASEGFVRKYSLEGKTIKEFYYSPDVVRVLFTDGTAFQIRQSPPIPPATHQSLGLTYLTPVKGD